MTRFACLAASVLILQPVLSGLELRDLAAQQSRTDAAIATMKTDLRNLVVSQEAYFSDHNTYASKVGPQPTESAAYFTSSPGNAVVLSNVSGQGWTGVMTNAALPEKGVTCGVFVGPPANRPNAAATDEGSPACWGTDVVGSGHIVVASDTANIRSELLAIADAWNRADLDGHVDLYSDSATMMGGRGLIRGKPAIRAGLAQTFWRDGKPLQQLRFEEIEIRLVGAGDVAIVTGKFILSGGDKPEASGHFSTIWVKENGRWMTVHDHSS